MTPPIAYSYVRLSQSTQIAGSGSTRQQTSCLDYCKAHNLILDDSVKFHDLGVSGYSGANLESGALGRFLKLCESGKIPKGSVLIVEALDRIQRTALGTALQLFLRLLSHVSIHTLIDDKTYTSASINNPIDIMQSILIMHNAWDESFKKSLRLSKAWEQKREKLGTDVLTAQRPGWIDIINRKFDGSRYTGGEYILIPERAELIKHIFEEFASGKSLHQLAKEFNAKKIETWNRGNKKAIFWIEAYFKKILTSIATIGYYQPHKQVSRNVRTPFGEPIKIFPPVVGEHLFYSVKKRFTHKNVGAVKSDRVSLLSGLVRCADCGSIMYKISKGKETWTYWICSNKKASAGCKSKQFLYYKYETIILEALQDIVSLNDLFKDAYSGDSITEKLNALQTQIDDKNQKINRWIDAITEEDSKSLVNRLKERIEEAEKEIAAMKEEYEALIRENTARLTLDNNKVGFVEDFQKALELVKSGDDKIKAKLRIQLQELIQSIVVDIKNDKLTFHFNNGAVRLVSLGMVFHQAQIEEDQITIQYPDGTKEIETDPEYVKLIKRDRQDNVDNYGVEHKTDTSKVFTDRKPRRKK